MPYKDPVEARQNQIKRSRTYRLRHPDRIKAAKLRCHERNKSDPAYVMLLRLRKKLNKLMRRGTGSSMLALLGCSIDEFKLHLVRRFQLGMTFFNYGSVWSVDHIVPCSKFDLSDPEQRGKCFHYTNLRPLFAGQNTRRNQ
jgi:hypothetical protein